MNFAHPYVTVESISYPGGWSWAPPPLSEGGEDPEPGARNRHTLYCLVEGCGVDAAVGHSYCLTHGTAMRRNGYPETVREHTRDAFLAAAVEGATTLPVLAICAVEFIAAKLAGRLATVEQRREAPLLVPRMLGSPEALRLLAAAAAYADHDAEAPLASFLEAQARLESAALALYRALPFTPAVAANDPVSA